jgi:hypothetical protein
MKRAAKRDPALVAAEEWWRIEHKLNDVTKRPETKASEKIVNRMLDQLRVAERQMERTIPTTMAGVAAMLRWAENQAREGAEVENSISTVLGASKK